MTLDAGPHGGPEACSTKRTGAHHEQGNAQRLRKRGRILELLSNDEVSAVSTAETTGLSEGDEYFEHLEQGVLPAPARPSADLPETYPFGV